MSEENSKNLPINELERLVEAVNSVKPKAFSKEERLTQEEKFCLISMIAHCYSNSEIKKEMAQKYAKPISTALINQYARTKKWLVVIAKIREKYNINISDARMFSKRSRMDRYERIYDRAVDKDDVDAQLRAVTQAHREIEGNGDGETNNFYLNNPVYNQLNLLSNEELLKRQKEATQRLLQRKDNNGPLGTPKENKE